MSQTPPGGNRPIWMVDLMIPLCAAGIGVAFTIIALALEIPPDRATAVGLAACIEYGLGLWAGAKLTIAVTGEIRRRHRALADRIERTYARMGMKLEGGNGGMTEKSPRVELFMAMTWPVQGGTVVAAILGLAWIIEWQLGTHGVPPQLFGIPALAALGLAAAGLGYQVSFLAWAGRKMAEVEERLDTQPSPVVTAFLQEPSAERYRDQATNLVSKITRERELTKAA